MTCSLLLREILWRHISKTRRATRLKFCIRNAFLAIMTHTKIYFNWLIMLTLIFGIWASDPHPPPPPAWRIFSVIVYRKCILTLLSINLPGVKLKSVAILDKGQLFWQIVAKPFFKMTESIWKRISQESRRTAFRQDYTYTCQKPLVERILHIVVSFAFRWQL